MKNNLNEDVSNSDENFIFEVRPVEKLFPIISDNLAEHMKKYFEWASLYELMIDLGNDVLKAQFGCMQGCHGAREEVNRLKSLGKELNALEFEVGLKCKVGDLLENKVWFSSQSSNQPQYVKLKLYVSNQAHVDSENAFLINRDYTYSYIVEGINLANWTAPAGVDLNINAETLAGEVNAAWSAFIKLAEAVSRVGHGTDFDGNEIEADEPVLTACPIQLIADPNKTASQSLSQLYCQEAKTWEQFVKLMEHTELGKFYQ